MVLALYTAPERLYLFPTHGMFQNNTIRYTHTACKVWKSTDVPSHRI